MVTSRRVPVGLLGGDVPLAFGKDLETELVVDKLGERELAGVFVLRSLGLPLSLEGMKRSLSWAGAE